MFLGEFSPRDLVKFQLGEFSPRDLVKFQLGEFSPRDLVKFQLGEFSPMDLAKFSTKIHHSQVNDTFSAESTGMTSGMMAKQKLVIFGAKN